MEFVESVFWDTSCTIMLVWENHLNVSHKILTENAFNALKVSKSTTVSVKKSQWVHHAPKANTGTHKEFVCKAQCKTVRVTLLRLESARYADKDSSSTETLNVKRARYFVQTTQLQASFSYKAQDAFRQTCIVSFRTKTAVVQFATMDFIP